jgi:hypothetical protein
MLDFDYLCNNQLHIPAPSRLLILNISMKDSDLKKRAEKAASICLAAPFLKVPQAMQAAGFSDEDAQDAAKQMHVRRAILRAQQLQKEALPVRNTFLFRPAHPPPILPFLL